MHLKNLKLKVGLNKILLAGGAFLYAIYFAFVVFGWDNLFQQKALAETKNTPTEAPLVASHANVASSLLLAMGVDSPDVDLDFVDIFSNVAAGQDLYSVVYNKINVQPEKKAFKETAQGFGLTLVEADAVKDGSPTPFLNIIKSSSPAITQAQALKRVESFRKKFAERKDFYEFQNEMITQYAPTEIFYNGDIADSGFDLVYDLHIIEKILFQNTEDLKVGGEFTGGLPGGQPLSEFQPPASGSGTGLENGQYGFVDNNLGGKSSSEAGIPSSAGVSGPQSGDGSYIPKVSLKGITDYAKTKALPKSAQGDLLDPTFCANDYNLGLSLINAPVSAGAEGLQAISDALAAEAEAKAGGTGAGSDNTSAANTDASTAANGVPDVDKPQTTAELEEKAKTLENYFNKVPVAEDIMKWEDYKDCFKKEGGGGGTSGQLSLCLEVNFKYKTASAYVPGETCVACEVEKINDELWNTIKNNLSPNKAPGNIFEMAKCKKSIISNPNMNVVLMFKPILTQNNNGLVAGKDIVDRWNEFNKQFKPGWFTNQYKKDTGAVSKEEQKKLEDAANKKSLYDDASTYAAANSPALIAQQQLQDEIKKIVNYNINQTARQIKDFEEGSTGAEFGEFYRLLGYEMDKMQTYFGIYQKTFAEIGSQICPRIQGKGDAS